MRPPRLISSGGARAASNASRRERQRLDSLDAALLRPDLLNADLFRPDLLNADLLHPDALDCPLADPPSGNPTPSAQPLHPLASNVLVPTISFCGRHVTATSLLPAPPQICPPVGWLSMIPSPF